MVEESFDNQPRYSTNELAKRVGLDPVQVREMARSGYIGPPETVWERRGRASGANSVRVSYWSSLDEVKARFVKNLREREGQIGRERTLQRVQAFIDEFLAQPKGGDDQKPESEVSENF